jgi:hypothetical protein
MFTPMIRAASVSAWLALAALSSPPAAAQFGPNADDFGPQDEFHGEELSLGEAVAVRDGIVFIGIPFRPVPPEGRVAVFNQTTSGWTRVQTLLAPISGEQFGRAIAFRDGLVIVGSQTAAYVYKRSSGVWTLRQTLRPPVADGVTLFPVALRYEAGTLLASAYRGDTLNSVVYVFELDTNGRFFQRTKLRALDAQPGDNFGRSLSMTKTALLIGSPRGGRSRSFNVPNYGGTGAAYVFRRNTGGNWVQTQKLVPVEPAAGFGLSVAIDQAMIIVGAPGADFESDSPPDGHSAGGAAYVFLPLAGRYLESFRLRPRPDEKFAYWEFGLQVAMFGRHIAVTAVEPYGFISEFPRGFVFTYARDGSSILPTGIGESHLVSSSMALANNLLLIGDPGDRRCIFGCPGAVSTYDMNRMSQ